MAKQTQRDINERASQLQSLLESGNTDALWGGMYLDTWTNPDTSADASTPFGRKPTWGTAGGVRDKYTMDRAKIVKSLVKKYFPQATEEQLTQAATAAYVQNPRWDNENTRVQDMVSQIAANLGGLSSTAAADLQNQIPQFEQAHSTMVKARNAEDSKRKKGEFADLAMVAAIVGGPLAYNSFFGGASAADAAGLGSLNSFDTGAMASALEAGPASGLAAAGAASPTFGQLPGSTVAEAFGGASPSALGSGTLGLDSTIATGISPFASGSILGTPGLSSIGAGALAEIGASTGLNTAGLELASGAGTFGAPVSGINSILEKAKELVSSGAANDILGALGTMVSNNLVDKATAENIANVYNRIEKSNPFANDAQLIASVKDNLTNPEGKKFLHDLFARSDEFINPFQDQAETGFNKAASLVSDPSQHAGYRLANTAATGLSNLYTNPMSNPLMQAVARITAENSARRSSAGRGLNAGSMPAEMQDALLAALASNYSNIANPMNQSVSSGSDWYQGDTQAATQLGTAAANANQTAANTFNSLAGAGTNAWNAATNSANVGANAVNAHLAAMGNLATHELALRTATDPTIRNVYGAGNSSSAISSLANRGLDFLSTLF